ncbi:MAG: FMN-binding glutamate synthase family protein [Syntrophomonadaceae bacterium]|nr:FMN-binding glutamate synthase family protein [Syntrophomonadaceae bacterium]
MFSYQKNNDVLNTVNRGNPAESGLCTLCRADCMGRCETWTSSMKGRKLLYPRDFGTITAGSANTNHVGVSYNNLRIQGYNYGAYGLKGPLTNSADDCIFPNVSIETEFGKKVKTKSKVPIMTGALGSTFIAQKYWESFAVGAALVGFPIVVGENVVGIDRQSILQNNRIIKAPELERRIDVYLKYYDGYGAIIVQMNVEDTRNGVAEYLIEKYGDKVVIELKWGQGAKDIGGEIQVTNLDYAIFLKDRGYIVDPDPSNPVVQEAFNNGAIKSFARHSRLGYTDLNSYGELQNAFAESVAYLRKLGYKRITLKTGSYGMEALAAAIKLSTDAELDLLTIDGSGGGTGMSPWNMMESWGVPSIHLHAKAFEYAQLLAAKGRNVVDLAFAGGLAREDHIFKALALGAPFVKLVCMGRALMIPGFLGANVEGAIYPERREKLNGNWETMPKRLMDEFGSSSEEIFAGYFDVKNKVGADEIKNIPLGAIAVWTLADKLSAGLQQLMAGARKFKISEIARDDLFAANRETAQETGIGFITETGDEVAKKILNS